MTNRIENLSIRKLSGGEVNETFLYKSLVIHLSPLIEIPNEDVAVVLNRWSYPKKPNKLRVLQTSLQELPDLEVPEVCQIGEIEKHGREIPYWIESFIVGKSLLNTTFEGVSPQIYERIINWFSLLHNRYQQKELLRDYYHQRLISLKRTIETNGGIKTLFDINRVESLRRLLEEMQDKIDICVSKNEVVTTVHGDLRGENVLIDGDKIGVIDFEQGANGGDWFYDIQKLLMIGNNELPNPNRPLKYRPPLNMETKLELLSSYLLRRQNQDIDPTSDSFRWRQKLFSLDNSLSIAVLKYYLGGKGPIDTNAILHRIEVMEGEFK